MEYRKSIVSLGRRLVAILLIVVCWIGYDSSCLAQSVPSAPADDTTPPNFIVIFADDLGYGDLGSYGHPSIRTPNLDRMAYEGQKWSSFYAAASVCTPSRAALLTGRLPVRSGMSSDKVRVLFPNSVNGLPAQEITLAEQLKQAGYATACVGKWHLGHREQFLPTNHGFDYYYGIPYSNDMDLRAPDNPTYGKYWVRPQDSILVEHFNVPLLRNTEVIERPADQTTITRRYADETIRFIEERGENPFFVYLAHNLPHIPLFASDDFLGKSERGLYGDVVEEIDHGIGRIIATLERLGLDDNTIVVFTSDNGPWLSFGLSGGSAGLLYGGKGMTWEGGMRVPAIFWGPGHIEPGSITGMGSTLDLFTTFSTMAGVSLPTDRPLDGYDLSATLLRGEPSPRDRMFFYRGQQLYAARLGSYKAHFVTQGAYGQFGERKEHSSKPLLYHLGNDPGEQFDVASEQKAALDEIEGMVAKHRMETPAGVDQLVERE